MAAPVPPPPLHPVQSGSRYELNVGVMIQTLILASLVWVGTSVNTLTAQMAVVQSQMADVPEMKRQLTALQLEVATIKAQVAANTARLTQDRSR